MKPTYRIRHWREFYEKHHTSTEVVFRWVAVPTKHDGKGFRRLSRHPDGVAAYAAFHLMLQTAAKMPTRGTLADEDGPLDAEDLADATGFPPNVFEIGFKLLSQPKIAWLEVVPSCDKLQQVALQDRTGQDRTGQDRTIGPEPAVRASGPVDDSAMPASDESAKGDESAQASDAADYPRFPTIPGRRSRDRVWLLEDRLIGELQATFPAVDVPVQCHKAHGWCLTHKSKRKTAGGMPEFLWRWMSREQNRSGAGDAPRAGELDPEDEAMIQRRELERSGAK